MKKMFTLTLAVLVALVFAGPAMATILGPENVNTNTNVNTPVNTNTNVNTNVNTPTAISGSVSGAVSGSKSEADSKSKSSASSSNDGVKFEAPIIPGFAAAPGLTSVGTYACLGSLSFGLSGPMAGASFGITKIDKGCEHARDAVILMGWGYPTAALILLSKNDDTAAALKQDPKAQTMLKSSVPTKVGLAVGPSQDGAPQIAPATLEEAPQRDAGLVCKDRELRVRAGNGSYFCRPN